MPRVSYSQQFKQPGEVDRFPKYKLTVGEKSRIWIPEQAWMEWYHRIEAPFIEDGEVVMEVRQSKSGPYEAQKMQWIGNVFCLGEAGDPDNPGPMMLQGIDPANCPACESAAAGTGVAAPQQRFAAPVIKYKVKGRGQKPYDLVSPISAEILVWAYTARIHGMLFDLANERGGDLRKCDVRIELEDTPGADTYQKIKTLAVIDTPAHADPKVREYVKALWADPDNRPTDEQLRDACLGRDVARPVMLEMVRRAERQYRDANRSGGSGGDASAADDGFNGNLSEGIDSLLEGDPSADAGRTDTSAQVSPEGDPFADGPAAAAQGRDAASGSRSTDSTAGSAEAPAPSASEDSLPDDERAAAVEQAADGMFGQSSGDSASPEPERPTQGRGRSSRGPAEGSGNGRQVEPEDQQEPATVPAGAGGVVDFDDLFAD